MQGGMLVWINRASGSVLVLSERFSASHMKRGERPMISTIIFDCYGTLVDTGKGSLRAVEQILGSLGCGVDPKPFYDTWKRNHHELCRSGAFHAESDIFRLGLAKTYEVFGIEGDPEQEVRFMLNTLGKRTVFPEVPEVLAKLSSRFSLAVGSNSDHEPLLADLKRNRLEIGPVFSSESMGVYKPNAVFFTTILKALDLKPSEVVYVGDAQVEDVKGPSALGIASVWINRKNEKRLPEIPEPLKECADFNGLLETGFWTRSTPGER
ncbi:HAD family hydrolase [Paenibacillus sp. MBLB4367]|uniref:HAD family hydrolase n=1 Tax=Paenibacillus sp. MBLB4367 TaxID=3384767 RepID=UPI0039082A58